MPRIPTHEIKSNHKQLIKKAEQRKRELARLMKNPKFADRRKEEHESVYEQ